MPLKKLVPSVKTKKRQDANNNCTKISNEMIINGSVKNEGEESEFGKATKVFQGYLSRCGLSKVLMAGLTELHKNQKDIEDPTLFLKTYLEIASGTGRDFDKLKQIFAELNPAILGINAVVGKVRSELNAAKEFVDNELVQLKTAAAEAAARAELAPAPTPSSFGGSARRASKIGSVKESGRESGSYSIADLTAEEKLLAQKMHKIEENVKNLGDAEQQLRDLQRSVDGMRIRLEEFGDKIKDGLCMTSVEEVLVSKEVDGVGEEEEEGPGKTFDCERKIEEAEEEEEGTETTKTEGARPDINSNRLNKPTRRVVGRSSNNGNKNKNNDEPPAANEGKQKTVVKEIHSKVGSKDNEQHKAGGGTTKVYDKKEDYSNVQSKAGANDNIDHKAGGGTNKVFNEKADYSNVKSKAGANDNIDHKAAGGTTKVFNEKQDYSNVKSKAGANDNIAHKAGGGTNKVFDEKKDYSNVQSKAGANDNIKHKAGGGEKKIFDEKVVYK